MSQYSLPVVGDAEVTATDIGIIALGVVTIIFDLLTLGLGTIHLVVSIVGILVALALIAIYVDHARWRAQHSHRASTTNSRSASE